MKEWLEKQIESGFEDLQGLVVNAHIPVKDRAVNELLRQVLDSGASSGPSPDLRTLLRFVRKAEITSSEGTIAFDISISIP